MCYKNGREVKLGDQVVGRDWDGTPIAGIVLTANPTLEITRNIGVVSLPVNVPTYNSSDFLHVDDALPKTEAPKAS